MELPKIDPRLTEFAGKLTAVLAANNITAEIESVEVVIGTAEQPSLLKMQGVLLAGALAESFTAGAAVLPDGRLYLLSFQDPSEQNIPLLPHLLVSLLQAIIYDDAPGSDYRHEG
jgi:hypothetical protein